MSYISCAPSIYRSGGFYDTPAFFDEIERASVTGVETVGELFSAYRYARKMPWLVSETNENNKKELLARYQKINVENERGAASVLVELKDVVVAGSVIYLLRDNRRKIVYETYRPSDRSDAKLLTDDASFFKIKDSSQRICLFLGSIGSFNYGHWLTDDAARLRAFFLLRERHRKSQIDIIIPSYKRLMHEKLSNRWDKKRAAAIRFFLRGENGYDIRFIDATDAYHFERLYYPTPVSYHPVLKSPDALQLVVDKFLRPTWTSRWRRGSDRILVLRRSIRGRVLKNMDDLQILLSKYGFKGIDTERMSLRQQAAIFANAKTVVGVMGAGMSNTLFCKPDTCVIHLAPSGWMEPWYWDLASLRNHYYGVCYGPAIDTAEFGHMASFQVCEPALLDVLRERGRI